MGGGGKGELKQRLCFSHVFLPLFIFSFYQDADLLDVNFSCCQEKKNKETAVTFDGQSFHGKDGIGLLFHFLSPVL